MKRVKILDRSTFKKTLLILIIISLVILILPSVALAEDDDETEQEIEDRIDEGLQRALQSVDLGEIESFYNQYYKELNSITGGTDFNSFVTMLAKGGAQFSAEDIYSFILSSMFSGVKKSIPAVIEIIVIALIFSIIMHFKPSFGEGGVSKAAKTAQFVIIGTIAVSILVTAFATGSNAIERMSTFSKDFFPVLLALLTALGGITSAAILSPATVLLTTGVTMLYSKVILPLIIVLTVFTVVNSFSDTIKLDGFCSLIKSVIKWAIGISFTVFFGIVTIQGLMGAKFDGVSVKTAKYTIDKLIPVVGHMFSDTVDILISCTLLIKNAVGIVGIIIIAAIILIPIFSILAHYFLFKLSGAVLEPIADTGISKFAANCADVLMLLFAVVLVSAAMFFIMIAVILGAANTGVMLR